MQHVTHTSKKHRRTSGRGTASHALLSFVLALMLALSQAVGLSSVAFAEPAAEPSAPQAEQAEQPAEPAEAAVDADGPLTIGPNFHITTGGSYQIDPDASRGVIYIETTDPVTLVGSWTGSSGIANDRLSIDATMSALAPVVPGQVDLTIQNLWISSPFVSYPK
jgi:hypothetical protein